MRILLSVPSSHARLHNLVPLGWALRTAGHQVQIAGRPEFTDTITLSGLVAVPAGEGEPDSGGRLDRPSDVARLVDYASLWRPDLVVWDTHAPAGALTARAVGTADVRILGPLDTRTAPDAPGAVPVSGPDSTLDFLPPSLRAPGEPTNLTMRHVPYGGSAVLPAWLRRKPRKRRVYVSVGDASLAPLFDAVAGADAEFVCELSDDRIPPGTKLPRNVRLFESVPRDAVLASCAAVVHDGAPQVTMAALACGLPQLMLLPAPGGGGAGGEADLAVRVAGAGAALLAGPAAVDAADVVRLLTDADLAAHTGRLHEEVLAMPSPREVVPRLTALAGRRP